MPVNSRPLFFEPEDLSVCMYGREQCKPAHAFGPAVRDYYLIHYIRGGQGEFCFNKRTWHLQQGQGFLICPDQVTYYQADAKNPWQYIWIGFKGKMAAEYIRQAGLSQESPVFGAPDDEKDFLLDGLFLAINSPRYAGKAAEIQLLGLLYLFLAHLAAKNPDENYNTDTLSRRQSYVDQAIKIIKTNDHRKVSVAELASLVGLDRSYFGALFREETGTSPQKYSLELRMAKAKRLLGSRDLTIAAVARSAGYEDPMLFSRMFRRATGMSPSEYRQSTRK